MPRLISFWLIPALAALAVSGICGAMAMCLPGMRDLKVLRFLRVRVIHLTGLEQLSPEVALLVVFALVLTPVLNIVYAAALAFECGWVFGQVSFARFGPSVPDDRQAH